MRALGVDHRLQACNVFESREGLCRRIENVSLLTFALTLLGVSDSALPPFAGSELPCPSRYQDLA